MRLRLLVLSLLGALVALTAGPASPAAAAPADLSAFRGLGTWVDGYDFARELTSSPAVTAATVATMHGRGVRTIYLQAAKDTPRTTASLLSPDRLGAILLAAHARGMKVVAWYLPTFDRPTHDWRRLDAIMQFKVRGHHFDGVGLDIESTKVPVATRNARLVALSKAVQARTWLPVAAIVLPPVLTEVVHPGYWGGSFPWQALRTSYDVWVPMSYYTAYSRWPTWRDAGRSTTEDVRRIRAHLGARVPVHCAGGLAGASTATDLRRFGAACRAEGGLGTSSYDWATTPGWAWAPLRESAPR